jgi:hypothetical protein
MLAISRIMAGVSRRIRADRNSFEGVVAALSDLNAQYRDAWRRYKEAEEQLVRAESDRDAPYQRAHRLVDSADLLDIEIDALADAGLLPDDWDEDHAPSAPRAPSDEEYEGWE